MKPAPNATKCSISASSRAARRVTASAPTTLPSAATKAYQKALDTGEEVVAGVTGRILEHFREQPLERLPHLRPGAHPGGQEIVPLHRQVLHRQRILRCSNGRYDFRELGDGMRDAGCGMRREEGEQVVGVFPNLGKPPADFRYVLRIRILVTPLPDGPPAHDVFVGGLES